MFSLACVCSQEWVPSPFQSGVGMPDPRSLPRGRYAWFKVPSGGQGGIPGKAVVDPGFPRGGGANSWGGRQHTILPNFPKNCMKLKEFGPPGGRMSLAPPLDPPLERVGIPGGEGGYTWKIHPLGL